MQGAPEEPERPDIPEGPGRPGIPEGPDRPDIPEGPEIPEIPEIPGAPGYPGFPGYPVSFGAKNTVAGIAEAGEDVAVPIEFFVQRGRVDVHLGEFRLDSFDAFGSGH